MIEDKVATQHLTPLDITSRMLLTQLCHFKFLISVTERTDFFIPSLLLLKACYRIQLALELKGRPQPSKAVSTLKAACSYLVSSLPLFDSQLNEWKQVIAAEISGRPASMQNAENRLHSLLQRAPQTKEGEGIVMACYSLGTGGAERQMVALCEQLIKKGEKVRVIAKTLADADSGLLQDLQASRVPTCSLEPDSEISPNLPILDANLYKTITCLIAQFRECRPRIVHGWMDELGSCAALAAILEGVERVIVDSRSLSPEHFSSRGLLSIRAIFRALSSAPNVLFVNNSTAGANDYRRWLGKPDLPILVVRNSTKNLPLVHNEIRTSLTIGGIMRLDSEKQPQLFLDIAMYCLSRRPDASVLLVGDGPLKEPVLKRIEMSKYRNRIEYRTGVPNPTDLYREIDVLLVSSRVEGTPNVILEAQISGVPVVATRVGGIPECLSPANTSFLLNSTDTLADAAEKIFQASTLDTRSNLESRNFTLERFDSEKQANAYLATYYPDHAEPNYRQD